MLLLHPRPELPLRVVVRIRCRGDEIARSIRWCRRAFSRRPRRFDRAPGEPGLLLVEVIELRVAPRDRRGIVPDLRGERAPAVFEVEHDFVPHRSELHRVPRRSSRSWRSRRTLFRSDARGLHHRPPLLDLGFWKTRTRASGVCCSRGGISWPRSARRARAVVSASAATMAPFSFATTVARRAARRPRFRTTQRRAVPADPLRPR